MSYIISNSEILGGKPIIAGTRISVEMILEWIASGATEKDITQNYPHLSNEAIRAAVRYAAHAMKNEVIIDIPTAS